MRDSGYALPTTRGSARSTSPRSGYLLVCFLLRVFLDQDISSYDFFSEYSCVHRYKSEYTGCFPGANSPMLKSNVKVLGMFATDLMAFLLASIL